MANKIEVLTHSSVRITEKAGTDQERIIYMDPYEVDTEYHDADVILVTHDHFDHFSPDDIAKISTEGSILVVPVNMEEKAQEAADLVGQIVTIEPWGSVTLFDGGEAGTLEIEAIPSYNINKHFHPKEAGWVGYIVEADGQRIYFAGDTDATDEAKAVKCDVALVPIGGTYTMTPEEAADLVAEMKPGTAIPEHYANIVGEKEDGEKFARLVEEKTGGSVKVEVLI